MSSILMAHGAGGKMQNDLITEVILKHFSNPVLKRLEDSAVLDKRIAFTTDSYVINPIFFPGGNIGKLAIAGTVNDLLCSGAKPAYISMGLIIEEGFSKKDLEKILESAQKEAANSEVQIVCGDTKVVDRGAADGIFINTAGIGFFDNRKALSTSSIKPGDKIILSGDIGDHGISILIQREGLKFLSSIESDCASLARMISVISDQAKSIHYMRDPTRGGLGAVLAEIAKECKIGIEIQEDKLPIKKEVRSACELLGLDPLYIANEGKMILFVAEKEAQNICQSLRKQKHGKNAVIIGEVNESHKGICVMQTIIGGKRIVDLPRGDLLPRIC